MLRHNDGIDRISPMTISLFIRLRFPVRFRDLLTAAQEGKGMSEIVIEEDSYITGGTAGTHEDETYEAPATAQNADADFRVEESKIPTTQDRFSALEGSRSEVKVDGVSDEGSPSGLQRSEYSAIVGSQSAFVTTAQSSNTKTSVEQEEEDLIDYEDDEETEREAFVPALAQSAGPVQDDTYNGTTDDFITPCLKPSVCFCSRCNEDLLAEFQAKNEELRRRSLSIAAEDHSQEPALDEVVVVEHSDDADDGITYEGQAGDDNVYGSGELWEQDEYNENPETYLDEVPATHGAIEDTEEHSCDDAHIENLAEFDGDVAVQYHVSPSGEGDLSEQNEPSAINDFDALDYEHNHDEIHDESNALSSEEAQVSGVVDANFREFTEEVDHKQQSLTTKPQQLESAIAEAPLEEMRSRTSENLQGDGLVLLSPQNGRSIPKPLELQDEIDYEDEDDRISPQNNNTPTTQTTITSTNGSGKRMRSDEDLENVPSARSKGTFGAPPTKQAGLI